MTQRTQRIALFAFIVLAGLAMDQASKVWADRWLASPSYSAEFPDHPVTLKVSPEQAGQSLAQLLRATFTASREEELTTLRERQLLIDGAPGPHAGDLVLAAGQALQVRRRGVTVHPSFWEFHFVRNPGAAWGLMRNLGPDYRRPVFVLVSLLSIAFILFIYSRSLPQQRLLHIALASILSGALGNLVDRIRFGFVIDFIEWFVVIDGKRHQWPTFNIADAFISVGVGLLFIEVLRSMRKPPAETPPAAS